MTDSISIPAACSAAAAPQPTAAQAAAIASRDDLVFVSAGAGTGKTRVLVERFVELLRSGGATASQIVALTFTEKAAAEMKSRIRQECRREAERHAGTPRETLWREQYIEQESARIGTIHSFCAGLIRSHPVEAGVDPQFSQLEEAQALVLRSRVADLLVEQYLDEGSEEAVTTAARIGVRNLREFLVRSLGSRDLAERACALYDRPPREVVAHWRKAAEEMARAQVAILRKGSRFRSACRELDGCAGPGPQDKAEQARAAVIPLLGAFGEAADLREVRNIVGQVRNVLYRIGNKGRPKDWGEERLKRAKECMTFINKAFESLEKETFPLLDDANDEEAYKLGRELALLLRRAAERYDEVKREKGQLDFEDLLTMARRLVEGSRHAVNEFAATTKYLMVDEFQDTDPVQRDIIFALAGVGKEVCRRAGGVAVFFVGDAKQSIYRFRRADVSVFTATERLLRQGGYRPIHLDKNFRSTAGLIDFTNRLFASLMEPADGVEHREWEVRYEPLAAEDYGAAASREPPVELVLINEPEAELRIDELCRREAAFIAKRIRQLAALSDGPRPYGDVAILFRRTTYMEIYEEALDETDVPYHVESGGGFYRRQEVRDVINLLAVLNNRLDDVSLVGFLRSPMAGLSDESIFWLAADRGDRSIWERLWEPEAVGRLAEAEGRRLETARKLVADLSNEMHRISITALVRRIIDATNLEAVLATRRHGARMVLNVRKLIDVARTFDAGSAYTHAEFVRYLTEFSDLDFYEPQASVVEEGSDSVSVMTVHGAKGREFPVVFIPDCSSRFQGHRTPAVRMDPGLGLGFKIGPGGTAAKTLPYWLIDGREKDADLAESKRVLYVATTRAKRRLILVGSTVEGKPRHEDSWLGWLFEACRSDDVTALREAAGEHCRVTEIGREYIPPLPPKSKKVADIGVISDAMVRGEPLPRRLLKGGEVDAKRVDAMTKPLPAAVRADRSFTATELAEWKTCPAYWRFDKLLQLLPRREPPAAGGEERIAGTVMGRLVHAVLQGWDFKGSGDAEAIVRQQLLLTEPMDGGSRDRLAQRAGRLIAGLQRMPIYNRIMLAPRLRREVLFILNFEGCLIEGTIDLLLEEESGRRLVIDYKTDDVGAEEVGERAERYRLQLGVYQLAVAEIAGSADVEAAMIFLSPGECVMLPPIAGRGDEIHREIAATLAAIAKGDFAPVPGAHRRCGYRYICGGDACR